MDAYRDGVRARQRSVEPRFPGEEAVMRCDQGMRRPERRARLAEKDGRTAVVLDVPVEVCPACGQVWLSMAVAKQLDEVFSRLLSSGAEAATAHWRGSVAA